MRIEEFPGELEGGEGGEELLPLRSDDGSAAAAKKGEEEEGGVVMRVAVHAKRAAVGVGARMLFYPTLMYNVVRNRFEAHFHWWDQVDEHILLGAVPFPSDVLRLKELGVCGVVTLNESYERLVPQSLYEAHGIENLVLPTRDYLYAPSFENLCKAADFIHSYASCEKLIYVHCKAGRGRSTTVVLCYLVQYKQMTPVEAYEHVRSHRPRVLLASAQWQAVQEFYQRRVKKTARPSCLDKPMKPPLFLTHNVVALDDSTFVMVSESDLEGYNADALAGLWEISLVYGVQFASKTAFAGFSYLWVRCRALNKEALPQNVGRENCSLEAEQCSVGHPYLLQGVMVNP